MKKGLLRQFPREIRERIMDYTIESYELRDIILKLIDKRPMFIIRTYLDDDDLADILEEKDLQMIRNKLKSVLTYEWFYFKFKSSIKENMDKLIKDIAENFAFTILYQDKYEYDEVTGKIENCGKYNIEDYNKLSDFVCDYGLSIDENASYLEIDPDNVSSHYDTIAINYLHETLKQLLKDVHNERRDDFLMFFKLDNDINLTDRDFEELEYLLFEVFDTNFPMPDLNNPVGAHASLVSEIEKMDAKMLFELGKEAAMNKREK